MMEIVKFKKPQGYYFDYVTVGNRPTKYAKDLESLGYKVKIIRHKKHWFVYRKNIKKVI
jgi:hypothetical protein